MVSFGPKFKKKKIFNIYLGFSCVVPGFALPADLLPVDVVRFWFALPLTPPPPLAFFLAFAPELKTENNHINYDKKNVSK